MGRTRFHWRLEGCWPQNAASGAWHGLAGCLQSATDGWTVDTILLGRWIARHQTIQGVLPIHPVCLPPLRHVDRIRKSQLLMPEIRTRRSVPPAARPEEPETKGPPQALDAGTLSWFEPSTHSPARFRLAPDFAL